MSILDILVDFTRARAGILAKMPEMCRNTNISAHFCTFFGRQLDGLTLRVNFDTFSCFLGPVARSHPVIWQNSRVTGQTGQKCGNTPVLV